MIIKLSNGWRRAAFASLVALLLGGCGDGGVHEVRQWMDDVQRQTPVSVQKIVEPKKFNPFVYSARQEVDPFDQAKLQAAFDKLRGRAKSEVQPDFERRKEPMENFPLDSIKMVGTLERPGLSYALLQIDRTVFQAKVGNHIGQNFGMITRVTESEVELREIVRDPTGDWTERTVKLELQESGK